MIAAAKGYKLIVTLPASVAREKINDMEAYGARAVLCPGVPFADSRHYFHTAGRIAKETENAIFTNQFNNLANCLAHFEGTAPEIWEQSGHKVDAFLAAAGTGGTISGCSQYLK